MSNPLFSGEATDVKLCSTRTAFVKYFSNVCKKSLAFMAKVGVASASVQGLKLALSSLDGEARRDFQKLVWSDSAECGSWRCGSASGLHGL